MFDRFYKVSKEISLCDNKKYITTDIMKTEKNKRIRDKVTLTNLILDNLIIYLTQTVHLYYTLASFKYSLGYLSD